MITKVVLFFLILSTWYGVTIFVAPEVASSVDRVLGIDGFSDSIRGSKIELEWAITDIPSIDEFKSWALDIQNKISVGVESTKDTIDTIRDWAQQAEDTYNKAKNTLDKARDTIDNINQRTQELWAAFSGTVESNTQVEVQ